MSQKIRTPTPHIQACFLNRFTLLVSNGVCFFSKAALRVRRFFLNRICWGKIRLNVHRICFESKKNPPSFLGGRRIFFRVFFLERNFAVNWEAYCGGAFCDYEVKAGAKLVWF